MTGSGENNGCQNQQAPMQVFSPKLKFESIQEGRNGMKESRSSLYTVEQLE